MTTSDCVPFYWGDIGDVGLEQLDLMCILWVAFPNQARGAPAATNINAGLALMARDRLPMSPTNLVWFHKPIQYILFLHYHTHHYDQSTTLFF